MRYKLTEYNADQSYGLFNTLIGVERSGIRKDGMFCGNYVNLVRSKSNTLTGDMVEMANGVHVSSQISPASLNCRGAVHCLLLTGPLKSTPHGSHSEVKWLT